MQRYNTILPILVNETFYYRAPAQQHAMQMLCLSYGKGVCVCITPCCPYQNRAIFTVGYLKVSSFRIRKAFPEIRHGSPPLKALHIWEGVEKIGDFQPTSRRISITVRRLRLLLMTNRKSHKRCRLPPKSTTLNDLKRPAGWKAEFSLVVGHIQCGNCPGSWGAGEFDPSSLCRQPPS